MKNPSCALPGPGSPPGLQPGMHPGLQPGMQLGPQPGVMAGAQRLHAAGRSGPQSRAAGKGRRWRYITILFSDLCGSVALGEALDAPDYVRAVQHLRAVTRRVVAAGGGTIARLQGDGVLVFFHGDAGPQEDARRAMACALALHAAVRSRAGGWPLALHSGIHAGVTYLDDGDIERGRYDLIGCTPNIAARLAALAGRDQILASDVVLRGHATSFLTQGMASVQLRGCAQALPACEVIGFGCGDCAGVGWGDAPARLHA